MISLVNDFSVLLDSCAIVPISLCDFLLRLAEDPALYKPRWSREILAEVETVLQRPKFNLTAAKARYRIACMESAFPEAMVTDYERLTDQMPNEAGDRHVLAAAIHGRVDAILTLNVRHFPADLLKRYEIERLTPDEFLVHQWHLDSKVVIEKLQAQVAQNKKHWNDHLSLFEKMVPQFVRLLRLEEEDA